MSREIRVYDGAVESLSDAAGAAWGSASSSTAAGATRTGPTFGGRPARARRDGARGAAAADPDEHAGLPERSAPRTSPASLAGDRGWSTERKIELALASSARRVRARASRRWRRRLRRRARTRRDRQLPRVLLRVRVDLGLGLGLGLRRRGRRPDDGDRYGRPRSRRARPGGDRRRGGRARARARGRAPAGEPPVPGGARRVRRGELRRLHRRDALGRRRSARAVAVRGQQGEEVAAPQFRLVDDATDPGGLASAPFDGEGSPTRRTR